MYQHSRVIAAQFHKHGELPSSLSWKRHQEICSTYCKFTKCKTPYLLYLCPYALCLVFYLLIILEPFSSSASPGLRHESCANSSNYVALALTVRLRGPFQRFLTDHYSMPTPWHYMSNPFISPKYEGSQLRYFSTTLRWFLCTIPREQVRHKCSECNAREGWHPERFLP